MEKEQMLDLVSMGDLMIDFSCVGKNDEGRLLFERNPGGAPMNVAAQLSRLGGKAGVWDAMNMVSICTILLKMNWVLT